MNSKRRKFDLNDLDNNGTFMATVQNRSIKKRKLTLTDVVQVFDDGTEKFISPHMHVFDLTKEQLVELQVFDIITFNAVVCKYTKLGNYGCKIKNYALDYITKIEVVEVHYNE